MIEIKDKNGTVIKLGDTLIDIDSGDITYATSTFFTIASTLSGALDKDGCIKHLVIKDGK